MSKAFQESNGTCNYELHFTPAPTLSAVASNPTKATEQLDQILADCLSITQPCVKDYIWHKDPFSLTWSHISPPSWHQAKRSPKAAGPPSASLPPSRPYLWGTTDCMENMEDLWLIVHLLREITKSIPGSCARVWDEDGQFLLIEAAHHLPHWARPELMDRRVWLHQGKVHFVPPASKHNPTLPLDPSLDEAIQIINSPVQTEAAAKLQDCIDRRIAVVFPSKGARVPPVHVARCTLPATAAHVLRHNPAAIATAVRYLADRTPQTLSKATKLTNFGPASGFVTVNVPMNRCHYALLQQDPLLPPPSHPTHAAHALGLSIALGLEMACEGETIIQRGEGAASTSEGPAPVDPVKEAARRAGWAAFKARLESSGFFGGEREGSRRYKELLQKAALAFSETAPPLVTPLESFRAIFRAHPECSPESFPPESALPPPSDTAWVEQAMERLDEEMRVREDERAREEARRSRRKGAAGASKGDEDFDPANLVGGVEAFLNRMADYEGAEMPDAGAGVSIDPERFLRILRETVGLAPPEAEAKRNEDSEDDADFDSDSDSDERSSFWGESGTDEEEGEGAEGEEGAGAEQEEETFPRGPGFIEQYAQALESQLKSTTMGQSFHRVSDAKAAAAGPSSSSPSSGKPAASMEDQEDNLGIESDTGSESEGEGEGDDDRPVDVDVNLVENLLKSYAGQGGMAGPAGLLANLLGVKLPSADPFSGVPPGTEQGATETQDRGSTDARRPSTAKPSVPGPAPIDLDALD